MTSDFRDILLRAVHTNIEKLDKGKKAPSVNFDYYSDGHLYRVLVHVSKIT